MSDQDEKRELLRWALWFTAVRICRRCFSRVFPRVAASNEP
jgi:hypothetical protein